MVTVKDSVVICCDTFGYVQLLKLYCLTKKKIFII